MTRAIRSEEVEVMMRRVGKTDDGRAIFVDEDGNRFIGGYQPTGGLEAMNPKIQPGHRPTDDADALLAIAEWITGVSEAIVGMSKVLESMKDVVKDCADMVHKLNDQLSKERKEANT